MNEVKLDTRELDKIAGKLNWTRKQIGKRIAFEIESEAKQLAPKQTTALESSHCTVTDDYNGYPAASAAAKAANPKVTTSPIPVPTGNIIANVGPCVDYAEAVEFGHLTRPFRKTSGCQRFVAAHPFLTPAVEHVAQKYNSGAAWKELVE